MSVGMNGRRGVWGGAGAVLLLAGVALAQGPGGMESGPDGGRDGGALRGPRVRADRPPGAEGTLDGRRAGPREVRRPHEAFMRAIRALGAEGAPADVRPTPEQGARIREIEREFREATRAYLEEHGGEVRALRREGGEQGHGRPDAMDGPAGDRMDGPERRRPGPPPPGLEGRRMGERAAELRRNAPNAADYEARMWSELTEAQRAAAKVELDRWRAEATERRGEDYMERERKKRADGRPDEARPSERPKDDRRPAADLPARLRERLEGLPPEEREAAVKKFRERRARGGEGPGRDRRGKGAAKPAPRLDEVDVPKADGPRRPR